MADAIVSAPVDSVADTHQHIIGGARYLFRTPTLYDMPKMRRRLAREGVRRPQVREYRVAALAGVRQMAQVAGDLDEGERQCALLDSWYDNLVPVEEDSIDEPDLVARAALLAEAEAERQATIAALMPEVMAIEANLDRHAPPWRELRADAAYWDEVARIDVVRLLLTGIGDGTLPRDGEGLVSEAAYALIPADHRTALGSYALTLLSVPETLRKN